MKLTLALTALIFLSGCLDLDKWDRRYKTEARDKCDCMETWQKELSPNLQRLYAGALEIIQSTYSSSPNSEDDRFSAEQLLSIANLKERLTPEEVKWNNRLGKVFFDKHSALQECWNRSYEWSNEHPGNNNKYTIDSHARQMGCQLVEYFLTIPGYPKIVKIIFN